MSTEPFNSARHKLDRAKVHMDELEDAISVWLPSAYRVDTDLHFQRGGVRQYITPLNEIPAEAWSLLAGDAINNIRAALDHIIWDLTVHHQGQVPAEPIGKTTPRCWWRDVAFPIRLDAPRTWAPGGLVGVSEAVRQLVRDEQPFMKRKRRDARRDALWVLHELWNRDKHRTLIDVGASLFVRSGETPIEMRLSFIGAHEPFPDITHEWITTTPGPFKKRREVVRVRFLNGLIPDVPMPRLQAYLKKYARLTFDIVLDEGPGIRALLRECHERVGTILEAFAPEMHPPRRIAQSRSHCPDPRELRRVRLAK